MRFFLLATSMALLSPRSPAIAASTAEDEHDDEVGEISRQIAADPANPELLLRRSELLRLEGRCERAMDDLDQAERLAPDLPEIQLGRGLVQLELGQPDAARASLDSYVQRRPDRPDGWLARARAEAKAGDHRQAAVDYSRALAILTEPRPDHYLARARAQRAADGPEEALRGLDEGMARLGHIVSLELPAIDIECELGRFDAALVRLERVAAPARRKAIWLVRRAEILERAGRPEAARLGYSAALLEIVRPQPSAHQRSAASRLELRVHQGLERLTSVEER